MLCPFETNLPFFSGLIEDLTAVSPSRAIITLLFKDYFTPLAPPPPPIARLVVLKLEVTVDDDSFGFEFNYVL